MAVRQITRCSSTRVPDTTMQDSAGVLPSLQLLTALLPALGCWDNNWNTQPKTAEECMLRQQHQAASTCCKSLATRLQLSEQPRLNRQAATQSTAHSGPDASPMAQQRCAHSSQPTNAARSFSARTAATGAPVRAQGEPSAIYLTPKASHVPCPTLETCTTTSSLDTLRRQQCL
jgi:hypothetical protein